MTNTPQEALSLSQSSYPTPEFIGAVICNGSEWYRVERLNPDDSYRCVSATMNCDDQDYTAEQVHDYSQYADALNIRGSALDHSWYLTENGLSNSILGPALTAPEQFPTLAARVADVRKWHEMLEAIQPTGTSGCVWSGPTCIRVCLLSSIVAKFVDLAREATKSDLEALRAYALGQTD